MEPSPRVASVRLRTALRLRVEAGRESREECRSETVMTSSPASDPEANAREVGPQGR